MKTQARKRYPLLASVLLVIGGVVVSCFLWVTAEQRRYTMNRHLIAALVNGDNKRVLALVEQGADPNTRYTPTTTPALPELLTQLLHLSPSRPNNSPTALLIVCGAPCPSDSDIDAHERRPDTPQLVEAMLRRGANPNVQDDTMGWASLMWAISGCRPKTVRLLLDHGATLNMRDCNGQTPLIAGVSFNATPQVVDWLLDHGADVKARDDDDDTALIAAVSYDIICGTFAVHRPAGSRQDMPTPCPSSADVVRLFRPTSEPMTYKRLEEVLLALGFAKTTGEDFVAFREATHNSLVVLPLKAPDENISAWHHMAVRKAITGKRIATEETLEAHLKTKHCKGAA